MNDEIKSIQPLAVESAAQRLALLCHLRDFPSNPFFAFEFYALPTRAARLLTKKEQFCNSFPLILQKNNLAREKRGSRVFKKGERYKKLEIDLLCTVNRKSFAFIATGELMRLLFAYHCEYHCNGNKV